MPRGHAELIEREKALNARCFSTDTTQDVKPSRQQPTQGFTAGELLVIIGLAAFLFYLLRPELIKARQMAQIRSIQSNLHALETAKDQWALDKNHTAGDIPGVTEVEPYLLEGRMPSPIVGEAYVLNPIGSNAVARVPVRLGSYLPQSSITIP